MTFIHSSKNWAGKCKAGSALKLETQSRKRIGVFDNNPAKLIMHIV